MRHADVGHTDCRVGPPGRYCWHTTRRFECWQEVAAAGHGTYRHSIHVGQPQRRMMMWRACSAPAAASAGEVAGDASEGEGDACCWCAGCCCCCCCSPAATGCFTPPPAAAVIGPVGFRGAALSPASHSGPRPKAAAAATGPGEEAGAGAPGPAPAPSCPPCCGCSAVVFSVVEDPAAEGAGGAACPDEDEEDEEEGEGEEEGEASCSCRCHRCASSCGARGRQAGPDMRHGKQKRAVVGWVARARPTPRAARGTAQPPRRPRPPPSNLQPPTCSPPPAGGARPTSRAICSSAARDAGSAISLSTASSSSACSGGRLADTHAVHT